MENNATNHVGLIISGGVDHLFKGRQGFVLYIPKECVLAVLRGVRLVALPFAPNGPSPPIVVFISATATIFMAASVSIHLAIVCLLVVHCRIFPGLVAAAEVML